MIPTPNALIRHRVVNRRGSDRFVDRYPAGERNRRHILDIRAGRPGDEDGEDEHDEENHDGPLRTGRREDVPGAGSVPRAP